jgi:hypothetical protein
MRSWRSSGSVGGLAGNRWVYPAADGRDSGGASFVGTDAGRWWFCRPPLSVGRYRAKKSLASLAG